MQILPPPSPSPNSPNLAKGDGRGATFCFVLRIESTRSVSERGTCLGSPGSARQ